ncbi:hypothetical protein AVEN_213066-1, partial [Araneus ventricosus]
MRSCCHSACFLLLMDSQKPHVLAVRGDRLDGWCTVGPRCINSAGILTICTKASAEAGNLQSRWLPSLVGLGGGRCHRGLNLHCILYGQEKELSPLSGQHIDQTKQVDKSFDTFFIIKRITTNNETFHTVSPFLVEKALTANLGTTKSTRKLRSGDLLIEVATRKQAQQIVQLKSLDTIPVNVTAHATLNFSKGVISCGELLNVPMEEICKGFQSQGITRVHRIKIKRDGHLIDTKHLILTFHSPKIPESVTAGYIKLTVRPYIPNPLRCFKCQRFGHSKDSCRGTLTCARCAEAGHDSSDCKASEKCVNCKGSHTSFSRLCSAWKFEKEVIAEKVKKDISFLAARKIVKSRTPTPGTNYAGAVRKKHETTSPRILPTILPSVPFKASYAPSEICPRSIDPVLKLFLTAIRNETVSFQFKVPESNKNPPDVSDFKTVTNRKKLKDSQSYKPPQLTDKEHSEATNSVTKQSNITVPKNGTKSA